jgi:hypothetical protein
VGGLPGFPLDALEILLDATWTPVFVSNVSRTIL